MVQEEEESDVIPTSAWRKRSPNLNVSGAMRQSAARLTVLS